MASSDIEKGKGDEIFDSNRTKEEWKSTFRKEVRDSKSPMPDSSCIFRVPEVLRRQKKLAYQPDIVSIGPFHRGGEEFRRLENVKKWYLKGFLERTEIELDSLIASITEKETRARNYYAEPLNNLDQNDFVEMLILDGCFLIEVFRKAPAPEASAPAPEASAPGRMISPKWTPRNSLVPARTVVRAVERAVTRATPARAAPARAAPERAAPERAPAPAPTSATPKRAPRKNRGDPIFNVPCMLEYLYHDLLLLENQLPWFVLEIFYDLNKNTTNQTKSLSQVVIDFFKNSVADDKIFNYPIPDSNSSHEILHILDLIRRALVEQKQQVNTSSQLWSIVAGTGNWLRSKLRNKTPTTNEDSSCHVPKRIPSASTLSEAGVTFKKGERGCILNITFKHGVFTMPPLAIDERTVPLFRNLMAYEQCYQPLPHEITSYAVLMDNLIDTSKDVDLLCDKEIVANWLSAEDASKFFNELYNDTTVIGYSYNELCADVEKYHKVLWNRWREKLKRDYFGTPWATISFFAAFVLLVLTFLQTIYTIHPYYHPRD